MSEVITGVLSCLATGVVGASLCSLLVLPPAAWMATRLLSRSILRMGDDAAWQAPFAGMAASLPGALFLAIGLYGLTAGFRSMCLATPSGRLVFGVIALMCALAIVRAVVLSSRRASELSRLNARAHDPCGRLAWGARDLSLPVRELDDAEPFCALVGILRPVILVSRGALERLSDDELRAAMRHEAAHARRADTLLGGLVSLFSDLLPLPAGDLIAAYREARELAADDHAARHVEPTDLAAAILAIAKGWNAAPAAVALAAGDGVHVRVSKLLARDHATAKPDAWRRLRIGASLAGALVIGAAPVIAGVVAHVTCAKMAMP